MSSIEDANGNAIVRMNTVTTWAFNVLVWGSPLFGVWVVTSILAHQVSIAEMKVQIAYLDRVGRYMSQNVSVGDGEHKQASARTWLTTSEVAEREGISDRTVLNLIEQNQIEPPPVKSGRAWQISHNFRIVPKPTEED